MLILAAILVFISFPRDLWAHADGMGKHIVEAHRLENTPAPDIDGRLDEAAWQQTRPVSGFLQLEPHRGRPATDDTQFYVLYDQHYLYVGFRCRDNDPQKIVNRIARRGQVFPSDMISFYIDPHHDHRTGYMFVATPGGVQMDAYRYDDILRDTSWRGIWWVESQIDEWGWTAEFKIPFANFRFAEERDQVWGFDIERINKRKNEITVWKQMTQAGQRTRMSDLGHLVALRDIASGKAFEISPYLLSGGSKTRGRSTDGQGGIGLDVQYNLTRGLKTNLTVNPDFAQVEADQLEINLTRFPTRFAEKRPFFVEGNSFFETPLDLFFSRRIGSRGDILWGTKMTGKVGPYSIGFLGSQTGSSDALEVGRSSVLREEASYGALRFKKDILRRSNVGVLFAAKETDGDHSRVGGLDASLALGQTYVLSGQYALSFHPGSDVDNKAYIAEFSQRNFLWDATVSLERIEPLFETNQTGFLNKESYRGWQRTRFEGTYIPRWRRHKVFLGGSGSIARGLYDGTYFVNWQANNSGTQLAPDFEEDLVAWRGRGWVGMEFTESFWSFAQAFYERSREVELTDIFTANAYGFFAETNRARSISVGVEAESGNFFNFAQQAAGEKRQVSLFGTLRPQSNLAVDLGGSYARSIDQEDEVDGRFLVGSVRTTYLFTRDTFLRIFAQTERQRTDLGAEQAHRDHLFSALFGWEYSPKSHLFIAYNEAWSTSEGSLELEDRVVVLKLSYLANL